MPFASDPVEDEPRDLDLGVVAPVAEGHRRGGPARPVDVHHQEDGGSEGFATEADDATSVASRPS